ncbi:hypothetical protein B296_00015469 [Ensete ventricosum]|uniref:Uncharacterized protein n=1 Tax=Ensete ventricosum TaxID=4639 RepID=A0A426XD80_ENSVE|nr:hypothetical protein B296_00015469 [Ensete ventricosum]
MIGVAGELDYFSAHIRLREPDKSEDKAECKTTDSRAIGLATPWYRRGGTSIESSIPCSHRGRVLVVKGAEDVENTKANSKYQDKGGRADAKELHKTGVDGLLIKIAESEGLWVDARVFDQGTK